MRIGIITFHTAINYGAVLQCYALCGFLRRLGHEVVVIDYHRASPKWRGLLGRSLTEYPYLFARKIHTLLKARNANLRRRTFAEFVAQELPLTKRRYVGVESLRNDPPECDAYICGSDQIWNDRFWDGFNEAYFLGFGGSEVLRLAYAPGVPGSEFKRGNARQFRQLIADFDVLSARESICQRLIEEAVGFSPPVVADPTILFGEYADVLRAVKAPDQFILSYGLPEHEQLSLDVLVCTTFLKRRTGLPVIQVDFKDRLFGNRRMYSPFEWLWLIKSATHFVTNSYHGLIFALLFETEFLVVPRDGKAEGQDARLLFLLDKYGLVDRYIMSVDQIDAVKAVDWGRVSALMRKEQTFSRSFLEEALSPKPTVGVEGI